MYEFNSVEIVLSFIVTWVIGLTPPLVIRYAIVKAPIDKWPALGACVFFWFFNLILFITLGSQSRTHNALILVAFVSYWILRKAGTANEQTQYRAIVNEITEDGTTTLMGTPVSEKTKQIQEHAPSDVMTTRNQLRQRIKPGWSLLIGVGLALSWFAVLYMNGYIRAQSYMDSYSLENQVRKYVSGSAEPNEYDVLFQGREIAEKQFALCEEKMRDMFGSTANIPTVLSGDVRKILLQNKDCSFYEPQLEDMLYPRHYAQAALIAGMCGTTLAFSLFWVVTYPHIGWRRLALAVGPLAGIFAGLMWADKRYDAGELIAQISFVTIFSSVLILAARNAVEWIRRGFKEPTKH